MQPTVQSEQDKMVPIDTSGDPVEVELKEEDKKDEEKKKEESFNNRFNGFKTLVQNNINNKKVRFSL